MAASRPCISRSSHRASYNVDQAAAVSLMDPDRWAVHTPSLQQQGAGAEVVEVGWDIPEGLSGCAAHWCNQPAAAGREAHLSAGDSRVSADVAT